MFLITKRKLCFPANLTASWISGRGSGVDADYRDAALLTRNAEGSVEVASLDRPVGEDVRLPIGVFGSTGLIGPPDAVVPASEGVSAVSCRRGVARSGWWDRVDQRLGDC